MSETTHSIDNFLTLRSVTLKLKIWRCAVSAEEKDVIQEIFLAGLGILSSGRGELRKSIDKAVREGKLRRKEGQKLFQAISKKTEKQRSEMKEVIEEEINKAFSKLGIATPSDISRVLHRLERIEHKTEKIAKAKKKKSKQKAVSPKEASAAPTPSEVKPDPAPEPAPAAPSQEGQLS